MKYTVRGLIIACLLACGAAASAQDSNQLENAYTNSTSSWKRHASMSRSNDVSSSDLTGKTNAVADADNAARNARDRSNNNLTPMDQGNSQADLDTTAQIRKEIVANKNLSVNAQNVKIITANGQVVLRGPVNSSSEKKQVCDTAKRVAGSDKVQDQLEVVAKNTSTSN